MSEWNLVSEHQPPFNEQLILTIIGDKTQNPPPRRVIKGFLDSINSKGYVFKEWSDYHEDYFEVDAVAWQLWPEPYLD